MEIEVDKDPIYLLINYDPTQSILDIIKLLKQISTYRIWRQNNNHIYLGKHFLEWAYTLARWLFCL